MSIVSTLPTRYQPAAYQATLFGLEDPWCDPTFGELVRTHLDERSWVDVVPRWLHGSDIVFGELVARLRWNQREVTMYDRVVAEPRLTSWWSATANASEPLAVLADARQVLSRHYHRPFDAIGFNLYRDGQDSVAWHRDREVWAGEDPTVVIVSTGSPRPFQLRPSGGGPSQSWLLGHGDLLVMGGSCQNEWEHCVPKVAHAAGPRLSIMFRHHQGAAGFAAGPAV
ncbi:MAG: alpha-ketoglutarate-dependent dioxygenase AlkB [Actinomycetota bacterium]|jgi:alkylated DNA repair dioxygenase AlkB